MISRYYLLPIMICCVMIAGCSQPPPTAAPVATTAAEPQLQEPFKFHKMIESSPGEYFDILSWGRGAAVNAGSYMILRSDSADKKFTTTTGDLDGTITDVYNSDMDVDGNPEILIEAKVKDTINYTNIYAYEFNESKSQKLEFPKLTTSQRKGYHGADKFYIKEGKLIREFEVYDANTKDAKSTGQKRVLEYSMHSNELSVKEISKDTAKVAAVPPKQPVLAEKPKEEVKKTNRHREATHKKKKKHRRR